MCRLLIPLLLAAFAAFAAPSSAQQRSSRDCSDDNGVDRCADQEQRRVRALFGVPPIEELHAAGAEVRRAFYVDGYGRDQIALTFIRPRGRDPMVTIHFKKPAQGPARPPIEALVPVATWKTALSRGQNFDRQLVPKPAIPAPRVQRQPAGGVRSTLDDEPTVSICLHSWVATVESAESADDGSGRRIVRRITQDACGDSLAVDYAFELAALALPLFPFCAAIGPEWQRNDITRLASCELLEGDRLAAADALNQATELAFLSSAEDAQRARIRFHYDAKLTWYGAQIEGQGHDAFQAWIERTTGDAEAQFSLNRAVGERSDRVRVEGVLSRREPVPGEVDGDGVELRAPVTLIFTSLPNDPGLRVQSITVGAFARAPAADD